MAERARVTVLGGSSAWTPCLARALADRAAELPALDVRLVGRDGVRTGAVARFATLHARSRAVDHVYTPSVSVAEAAEGARIVVNQMRIGGFAGRVADEAIPLPHGWAGDETVGPSAIAAALRSSRETLEVARVVASVAPGCAFVQMANPMGILLHTLTSARGLRAFGLCELPEATLNAATALAGIRLPPGTEVDYVGINHLGFVCRVGVAGEDVLPTLVAAIAAEERRRGAPVPPFAIDVATMREFGALPLPYLRIFVHRERALAAARASSRGAQLANLAQRLFAHYASAEDGELPTLLGERPTPWLDLALAPALVALLGGPPQVLHVSEPNHGHLPFLPADAIVEKRARLDAVRCVPLAPSAASLQHPRRRDFLRAIARFESAAAAAAREPSHAAVRTALACLPDAPTGPAANALARDLLPLTIPGSEILS